MSGKKRVIVIGCGFSGLSVATYLADKLDQENYSVMLVEKNDSPGGRARQFQEQGFVFDMGPSWYWMPDIFENYFRQFGKNVADYYKLIRLNPSYRVIYNEREMFDVPADYESFKRMLESIEAGSGQKLDEFIARAKCNYEVGVTNGLMRKSEISLKDLFDLKLLRDIRQLGLFQSMADHVRKYFSDERIIQLMEFPVLFIGGLAKDISSGYSLLNYADIVLGTWYPLGGMYEIIKAMVALAEEKGVEIRYSSEVRSIDVDDFAVAGVTLASGETVKADFVIASADYQHVDRQLLPACYSNYNDKYWNTRKMAPSALIFYLGVSKRLKNLRHHNLFFDESIDEHGATIFKTPNKWPAKPLFYVCAPSITDPSVAPEGMENLFILVPLGVDLKDDAGKRERCYDTVMNRLERITDQEIRPFITFKRSYALDDFVSDYHAFKGNAYGLSNILSQSAIFKPRIKNNVVKNLYYAGQLTIPGPGVPTCIVSGEIIANKLLNDCNLLRK